MKNQRDATKIYPVVEFIAKLRRLADALESDSTFEIQIQSERIYVPKHATCSIEHERDGALEEIEFQVTWRT
jgi:amphi-Trp domain-containing protein